MTTDSSVSFNPLVRDPSAVEFEVLYEIHHALEVAVAMNEARTWDDLDAKLLYVLDEIEDMYVDKRLIKCLGSIRRKLKELRLESAKAVA